MLWMFKRVFFGEKGELVKDHHQPLKDLSIREMCVIAPLILMVFWMGVFPNQFLDYSKASLDHFVQDRGNYNLAVLGDVTENTTQPIPVNPPAANPTVDPTTSPAPADSILPPGAPASNEGGK